MAESKLKIINNFVDYFTMGGGDYSAWYVGISKDAKLRLLKHGVREKSDSWIFDKATSVMAAREIEEYFIKKGTDGNDGGEDEAADMIYAYKKASHTNP
jgi:hypothetical protein